ncbi:hypothetical protein [Microvirga sp. P5_D2]
MAQAAEAACAAASARKVSYAVDPGGFDRYDPQCSWATSIGEPLPGQAIILL